MFPWLVVGVVALGGAALVATGVLGPELWAAPSHTPLTAWAHWLELAGLCTAAEALPVRVRLGRGKWESTLLPLAVVVGLGRTPPVVLVAIALVAATAVALVRRTPPGGAAGRWAGVAASSAGAVIAFLAGGGTPAAIVAAGVALCVLDWVACYPFAAPPRVWQATAGFAVGFGLVTGTTALALVRLGRVDATAPLLLLPLGAAAVVGAHYLASRQADHDRLDRLATASARTTGLRSFEAAVAQAAAEAGTLVGGAVAISVAVGEGGALACSVVDGAGVRPASPDLVTDVLAWLSDGHAGERAAAELPLRVRALRPDATSVVSAGLPDAAHPGSLAVVVLRDRPVDREGPARGHLLETFVNHAGLIASNAVLFQRVEAALRDQVDMNRQKDEFLAAVSHELRTPLASMLGSVETLRRLDGRMAEESRDRFFTIAHRQGKRLQRLIEELLLTASLDHRQEVVVATTCRLAEVFEEVAVDLADQSQGRILARCEPGAETISTDPHKIRQVVTNLVENATKYAPEGDIEVLAVPTGSRIEVRVVDHGPGIGPQDRARAFDRFVQLDGSSTRAQGGTGLGLYLCRRVADLLEGELELRDTPGGGATFILSLPREHSTTVEVYQPRPDGAVAPTPPGGAARFNAGPFLDRSLMDLRRGPSSGPAAGLGARPVVPTGLQRQGDRGRQGDRSH